jgi:hypothetical protein
MNQLELASRREDLHARRAVDQYDHMVVCAWWWRLLLIDLRLSGNYLGVCSGKRTRALLKSNPTRDTRVRAGE